MRALLIVLAALGTQADSAPREDLTKLRALIVPQPDESKWARVDWLTSVKEARERSVAEDKPIFLWRAGGGDVLGRA